jgi:hypothetical protein
MSVYSHHSGGIASKHWLADFLFKIKISYRAIFENAIIYYYEFTDD